jgi:hypothetical protein
MKTTLVKKYHHSHALLKEKRYRIHFPEQYYQRKKERDRAYRFSSNLSAAVALAILIIAALVIFPSLLDFIFQIR